MTGMNLGIDIIVGKPLTAKSVPNVNDMPKFYATINTKIYDATPTKTNATYSNLTSNVNNTSYTNSSSYGIKSINASYFKTDTYDTKHKFTSTQTKTPKFDMSSSYDNINFNYQTKE